MHNNDNLVLLSTKETSEYSNISKSGLYNLYTNYHDKGQGFPKPIRIGGKVNFLKSDLDNWILSQQEQQGGVS